MATPISTSMATNLVNPCIMGKFSIDTALTYPSTNNPAIAYKCTLASHQLLTKNDELGNPKAQMDDLIGHITSSTPKASAFHFFHNVNWSANVALNYGDQLAMWVSYFGWDETMSP